MNPGAVGVAGARTDPALAAFAPAKVNLFLHVGTARADGYHPISSLMVFADVGDRLSAEPSDGLELVIEGPFAGHAPADESNLVLRAVRALAARSGIGEPGLKLTLVKNVPAAAGLGGGSSDAAAALRLASSALGLALAADDLREIGAGLGSDVPACLDATPVLASGRGEILSAAPAMAALPAVLAKPPRGASTAAIYRAFDAAGPGAAAEAPVPGPSIATAGQAAALVASTRNDLEAPALALEPQIGQVLQALRAAPESLAARMSGSGSACFAICRDEPAAAALAARLQAGHPDWWVRPCRLGGPWI